MVPTPHPARRSRPDPADSPEFRRDSPPPLVSPNKILFTLFLASASRSSPPTSYFCCRLLLVFSLPRSFPFLFPLFHPRASTPSLSPVSSLLPCRDAASLLCLLCSASIRGLQPVSVFSVFGCWLGCLVACYAFLGLFLFLFSFLLFILSLFLVDNIVTTILLPCPTTEAVFSFPKIFKFSITSKSHRIETLNIADDACIKY